MPSSLLRIPWFIIFSISHNLVSAEKCLFTFLFSYSPQTHPKIIYCNKPISSASPTGDTTGTQTTHPNPNQNHPIHSPQKKAFLPPPTLICKRCFIFKTDQTIHSLLQTFYENNTSHLLYRYHLRLWGS